MERTIVRRPLYLEALSRVAIATAVSALVALVASELVLYAASAAGLIDRGVVLPSFLGTGPLGPASVAATAIAASLGAGILFGIVVLTTRRPVRWFRIAATILAMLSLSMPVTIPGPSMPMRAAMATMHIAVWAVAFALLPTLATTKGSRK